VKVLIVFDSLYGNTQKVAEAIGKSMGAKEKVAIIRVAEAKTEDLLHQDYLIVGSPTQAFNPTRAVTQLLKSVPSGGLKGTRVAAFDTRMSVEEVNVGILKLFAKMFGYAAKSIAKLLAKKGGVLIVPPEGFFVKASEGPLKDGELERAAAWMKQILSAS
jgi:flavodoxin I